MKVIASFFALICSVNALTNLELIIGWTETRCDEAKGNWTDLDLGGAATYCVYSSDYEAVDESLAVITSSDCKAPCALNGVCVDVGINGEGETFCDAYLGGGGGGPLKVILIVVAAIVVGVLVYYCAPKKRTQIL